MNGFEERRRRAAVAAAQLAERDAAIALLEQARRVLDEVVEPAALREPLRLHLAATIERCQAHKTILGLPVMHTLKMARVIVSAHTGQHGAQEVSRDEGTDEGDHQPGGD